MADITIEEIRKRHANYPWPEDQSWQDIDFLLAELDRMKIEANRADEALRLANDEVDRLKAENAKLSRVDIDSTAFDNWPPFE